jgi:hypothetical protein
LLQSSDINITSADLEVEEKKNASHLTLNYLHHQFLLDTTVVWVLPMASPAHQPGDGGSCPKRYDALPESTRVKSNEKRTRIAWP